MHTNFHLAVMKQTSSEDSGLIKKIAIGGDFILLNLSMILTYLFINEVSSKSEAGASLKTFFLLSNMCYFLCVSIFGIILHKRIVRPEIIVKRLMCTIGMHIVIFVTALALLKIMVLPRLYLLHFYVLFTFLVTVWRLSLRVWVKTYRSSGKNQRNVVLIGDGYNMTELYHTMTEKTYGYHIVGIFHDGKETGYPTDIPYKGSASEAIEWMHGNAIQELYCDLPSSRKKDILNIMNYCENNLVRFYSVPHIRNYIKRRLTLGTIGEVPILSIRKEPLLNPNNKLIKRIFDIAVSSLFLICIFPWMCIIIGILVKLGSKGPVFFTQERTGENGKVFKCYKFRSMRLNVISDSMQATTDDPRTTRFGKFLRKTNLDEFPQFINVLKGNMSIVGPRPHMLKHTQEYSQLINKYMMRHLIKPGITGWAQVNGYRGETKELFKMEERVRHDLWYIENWSFLLDIRIILKTITNMIHGEKNAY